MKLYTLHDCFVTKLKALYDVETQIIKALPKMIRSANSPDLKEAFESHVMETKSQIERLEAIFKALNMKPGKIKVEAIRGLIDDASWVMDQDGSPAAMDAVMIAAAQYVEHYEMAGYGSLLTWARIMGHIQAVELLEETLHEERAADKKLTEVAQSINILANTTPTTP